jgi:hypothetical protein
MLWIERLTYLALIAVCLSSAVHWRRRAAAEIALFDRACEALTQKHHCIWEQWQTIKQLKGVLLQQDAAVNYWREQRVTGCPSRN